LPLPTHQLTHTLIRGSAIAKIVGENVLKNASQFAPQVKMWVYEEVLQDGRSLSRVINETHENAKYLPGVRLPENVEAVTDLAEAAGDASVLVFVLPHQFVRRACQTLKWVIADDVKVISLTKVQFFGHVDSRA
jgi:glycerol-3-phosphate dehydrogenase (NAD+)